MKYASLESLILAPLLLLTTTRGSTTALATSASARNRYKAEWVKLNPAQRITPRRSGLVAIPGANQPLVFGGYAEVESDSAEEKCRRFVVNDLWEWQPVNQQWKLWETQGDVPEPRLVGAAAVLSNKTKAYLMGGWNSDAKDPSAMFLDTVHELDLASQTWKLLANRIPDGPTSRHVALALPGDDKILLHNHRCVDYVYLWDIKSQKFSKQATKGPCPSPRGLHAACCLPRDKNKIVFFGGAAQDGTMSNQVFVLDTDEWTWEEKIVADRRSCPTPRASPCLCALNNDNHVIMFGGAEAVEGGLRPHGDVWLFEIDQAEWTCLVPSNRLDTPPPRNGAVLMRLNTIAKDNDDDACPEFLLAGGWAPFQETWDDYYILRVTQE